jgi:hypothetical protein
VAESRLAGSGRLTALDAGRLVFVEEMGSNVALASVYAYDAPKGERAYCSVPHPQSGQEHPANREHDVR